MKFKVLVWLMGDYISGIEKMEYLTTTAEIYGYDLEFMGVNEPFINFLQKLPVLEEALETVDDDTIVLCMDAWDTLFNVPKPILIRRFMDMNTGLLMSAEKLYTYQFPQYKGSYDEINSSYRYVNAGTFMGYAEVIKWML